MRKSLVIGLAGGTGSGKSTVCQALAEAAGTDRQGEPRILILPQDAYYRAQPDIPLAAREKTNYDQPNAFDSDLLLQHVDALIAGETIAQPVYDFAAHNRKTETVAQRAKPVLLIEGLLVLHDAALRERLDLCVFVDTPADERFIRRLERDVRERGRSPESVIAQYRESVKPMHDLFIEPSKQHAHLILPEGGSNHVALEVLQSYVRTFVSQNPENLVRQNPAASGG